MPSLYIFLLPGHSACYGLVRGVSITNAISEEVKKEQIGLAIGDAGQDPSALRPPETPARLALGT
jgi:hypothetical protein